MPEKTIEDMLNVHAFDFEAEVPYETLRRAFDINNLRQASTLVSLCLLKDHEKAYALAVQMHAMDDAAEDLRLLSQTQTLRLRDVARIVAERFGGIKDKGIPGIDAWDRLMADAIEVGKG